MDLPFFVQPTTWSFAEQEKEYIDLPVTVPLK